MTPEFIYLHGFASSPKSRKAIFFKNQLTKWGISLHIPDLNTPDFSSLTLTSMIERLAQEIEGCAPAPVNIIGSSLGALVALHFVDKFKQSNASQVTKMLLLAPALDFVQNRLQQIGRDAFDKWKTEGWFKFLHYSYNKEYKVNFKLINDITAYNSDRIQVDIPVLIYHGRRDNNVNCEQSIKFAENRDNIALRLIDSDHMLLDQLDKIWPSAVQFFDLCTIHSIKQQNIIQIYNLANAADVTRFKPYEDTFLDLLKAAYGNKLYEREVQLNRIYGQGHSFGPHYVFLAFSKGIKIDNVVGCSYIRSDGKRGATAVLPQYQGRGIGRQLVCASLKLYNKQFTEISPSDLRMKHLLTSLGFRAVTSESELNHNLGRAAHLLRSIRYQDYYIIYTRSIPACQGVERDLVMFIYHQEFL
jgi:predicted esterase YcpF (UPF0227 family)/GNAT superfamily N-acetyltransferase